jgi:hypothetical protein
MVQNLKILYELCSEISACYDQWYACIHTYVVRERVFLYVPYTAWCRGIGYFSWYLREDVRVCFALVFDPSAPILIITISQTKILDLMSKRLKFFTFLLNGAPLMEPNPLYAPHLQELHVQGCDQRNREVIVEARSPYHAVLTLFATNTMFRLIVSHGGKYNLQVHMKANLLAPKRCKYKRDNYGYYGRWDSAGDRIPDPSRKYTYQGNQR